MPRKYQRRLGARPYKDYSNAMAELALRKIAEDDWSIRRAAAEYKIPFGTLRYKYIGVASFDPERVLQEIPSQAIGNDTDGTVNNVLVKYLQQQRLTAVPTRRNIKRIKLSVEPGKSVTACIDGDSSASDVDKPLTDDNSDDNLLEDTNDDVGVETEYFEPEENQIAAGKFVLVKVYGGSRKKAIYRHTAIIQQVRVDEEGKKEINLLGMKSVDKSKKIFAVEDGDEFVTDISEVLAILPNPSIKQSEGIDKFFFERVIDVFEMK
ncbi:unnamed protein product [Acanthoscelides obtectus]|uniref:HTH psq-type domain-containing protein n=1 Tax=Acanthoscelides obtectus TaxID=200917 RepID=A0A9P0KF56_ACAOB|nr:unnamed protein product [Acanthoscelides obtectus]CAK1635780.1 hypothetical protein AOBTE_LOCUS9496 [Acanthoscelides obtectus]